MKFLAACVAVIGAIATNGADLPLDKLGARLDAKEANVLWEVCATNLPNSLEIYKVVPRRFSVTTLSNLIEMAAFENPESAFQALKGAADGKETRYEEPRTKKFLGFYPATGSLIYQDTSVIAEPNQPVDDVPNEAGALNLAFKLLPRIGIATDHLATKPDDAGLEIRRGVREMTKMDKATGQKKKTVLARDVIFARRENRINFAGVGLGGGVEIRFGNKGRVGSLRVVWRDLETLKRVPMPDREEIIRLLKSGNAVVEATDETKFDDIRIQSVTPYYFEQRWNESQAFVFPYLTLQARVAEGENGLVLISLPIANGK